MGAGTIDIAVCHDGSVRHTAVLPIGGNHVTNDIVTGLRTTFADAERIKQRYGVARAAMASSEERIEVPSAAGKWKLERLQVSGAENGQIPTYIVAFGEDAKGELYVLTNDSNSIKGKSGKVWKIVPAKGEV